MNRLQVTLETDHIMRGIQLPMLVLVLSLGAMLPAAEFAKPGYGQAGNSGNAHFCQQAGWTELACQGSQRTPFADL
jgi:hypothetical protein